MVFRRDNNVGSGSGKTSWLAASRVIGFEGKKNVMGAHEGSTGVESQHRT